MDAPKAGFRQRAFAWAFARANARYERFISKHKEQLFAGVSGTALEIGPGTGANLRYLRSDRVRWIGIEPNPFMRPYLQAEATKLGLPIDIRVGIADPLPLPDESVDVVISTLVLCSVPSQQRCLQEVLRVLKPGGRFLFIEHVAAPKGTWLRVFQNLMTPLWSRLGDGCHPNRETWVELEHAGFETVSYERITAPTTLAGPQIVGVAVKAGDAGGTSLSST